jgi:hypothetical protein
MLKFRAARVIGHVIIFFLSSITRRSLDRPTFEYSADFDSHSRMARELKRKRGDASLNPTTAKVGVSSTTRKRPHPFSI